MTVSPALDRSNHPRVWRLPGVYRPQEDSFLLAAALQDAGGTRNAKVLDFCTGSGFLAVTAARSGAASVTALDIAPRAVLTARLNARSRRLPINVLRGDLDVAAQHGPFDVVLSNPPYVPHDGECIDPRWDAGPDGRCVLDPLCDGLPNLLSPGGFALLVHSEFTGVGETLARLRAAGLGASVVARDRIPFGPVLHSRAQYLQQARLIEQGEATEEVVVIRADRSESGR
ncbi:HemK2/MTQ2 family protein methyltransferase [Rhodococcus chondri]|uniref:Methyltransferase n=1 Tax=Rhodococcus chondri TaxID=3065941 RepID=A0ABU7JSU4_9NOCA|nr:HemK2/MTQ2 family protein methyltransferase [Rhodococcus sp. CC-R104]MEE2033088.1 methyltransferase [Rhodococcus sp. CC-R104]